MARRVLTPASDLDARIGSTCCLRRNMRRAYKPVNGRVMLSLLHPSTEGSDTVGGSAFVASQLTSHIDAEAPFVETDRGQFTARK